MPDQKKIADHYFLHLGIILLLALVAVFIMSPGVSKFFNTPAAQNSNAIGPFQTINENFDFSIPRSDNLLAPEGWYFGTDSTNVFPFHTNHDITPWDTNQIYLDNNGLFLVNTDYSTYFFSPTYKFSKKPQDKIQIRSTLVYSTSTNATFSCCAQIKIAYTDGINEINSLVDIDGREPENTECIDSTPVWASCNREITILEDQVKIVTNFYPIIENIEFFGMLYYPSGGGIEGVTINQLKLEILQAPGQVG